MNTTTKTECTAACAHTTNANLYCGHVAVNAAEMAALNSIALVIPVKKSKKGGK